MKLSESAFLVVSSSQPQYWALQSFFSTEQNPGPNDSTYLSTSESKLRLEELHIFYIFV